jgi:uroporphyrinogen-III synthase
MSLSDRSSILPLDPKNLGRPGEDRDVALLSRAVRLISDAGPLNEALNHVVDFIATVVTCDSCLVYVLEKDDLILRTSRTAHPEMLGRLKMKIGRGTVGWVAENRGPLAIADRAYEDFRFLMFNGLPEDHFEAFLSVPMVTAGRLVGVINTQNRMRHQYSKREIDLVATIGFLVGTEIERERLKSHNSAMLEKLETRTLVDRAKTILQRSLGMREEEAYRIMQRESQDRNKSMREIADAVILMDGLKQRQSLGGVKSRGHKTT